MLSTDFEVRVLELRGQMLVAEVFLKFSEVYTMRSDNFVLTLGLCCFCVKSSESGGPLGKQVGKENL